MSYFSVLILKLKLSTSSLGDKGKVEKLIALKLLAIQQQQKEYFLTYGSRNDGLRQHKFVVSLVEGTKSCDSKPSSRLKACCYMFSKLL